MNIDSPYWQRWKGNEDDYFILSSACKGTKRGVAAATPNFGIISCC